MNAKTIQSIFTFPLSNTANQIEIEAAVVRVHVNVARAGMFMLTAGVWVFLLSAFVWMAYAGASAEIPVVGAMLGSAILLLWAFLPRIEPPPPDDICINSADFPALYKLVADLAQALGATMPKVVLTERYVASFGRFGWQNTPIIFLGHGLLSVANRQETMLLIAHELMHVRESGWDQSRLIKMTWGGFERLHYAISLQWISPALVQFTLMRMLLAPTTLILLMMRTCLAVEQRHLERRADKAALQFCNRTAMQTLLKKSAYVYVPPIQSAYDQAAPSQKYDAICASEASIEPAKFDRLWQAIHSAETKIFDKHPSASERIQASKDPSIVRIRAIIEPRDYRRLQLELKRWPVWLVQRQYQFASVASNDSITLQPALEA